MKVICAGIPEELHQRVVEQGIAQNISVSQMLHWALNQLFGEDYGSPEENDLHMDGVYKGKVSAFPYVMAIRERNIKLASLEQ